MIKVPDENSTIPWDIKTLKLSLGGEADENGFVTFEIFDDDRFCIYTGDMSDPKWFCEDIDVEAARRLRDFLNYAVPNVQIEARRAVAPSLSNVGLGRGKQ